MPMNLSLLNVRLFEFQSFCRSSRTNFKARLHAPNDKQLHVSLQPRFHTLSSEENGVSSTIFQKYHIGYPVSENCTFSKLYVNLFSVIKVGTIIV